MSQCVGLASSGPGCEGADLLPADLAAVRSAYAKRFGALR